MYNIYERLMYEFNLYDFLFIHNRVFCRNKYREAFILVGFIVLILGIAIVYHCFRRNRRQLNITKRIAEYINDAIIITDQNTNIVYANNAFEKATGYKKNEVLGLKPSHFKSNKQSKKFYEKMWESILQKGYWNGELWDKKKDGMIYPKKLTILSVKSDFSNKVLKYIGVFTDLTKTKEEQKYIAKLKNYNIETDLPNEKLLMRLIEDSIKEEKRNIFIVYFSVKNHNNMLFNMKEDDNVFLNTLIKNIKDMIKEEDFIAQLTKNNFVIVLSSLRDNLELEEFLKIFFNKNKKIFYVNGEEIFFDIKAGIAVYPKDALNSKELITNAYIALENSLVTKEKDYVYYNSKFKKHIEQEIEMNLLLRKAISNEELDVYYQPQVTIDDGNVVGAEALLRWNNKQLGNVSPSVFIALAEKTGQIIEIGYWLIEKVFKDYLTMKKQLKPDFRISINISPVQFKDRELVSNFKLLAKKYNITNFDNFEIEITESILMSDFNMVNEKLNEFKVLGITIAIDDFGTGFSCLSYLKKLHVDKIKIDRSFIKDYPKKDNGDMAEIITNMANKLNLKVITEGVDNIEQIKYLKTIGCNLIQGYYYSAALTKNDFCKYISVYVDELN